MRSACLHAAGHVHWRWFAGTILEVASVSEFEKDLRKKKEGTDTTVTKYISANGKYLAKTVKVNTNPEQKYFHHIDLVGSIRAITDVTGTVTESYEY